MQRCEEKSFLPQMTNSKLFHNSYTVLSNTEAVLFVNYSYYHTASGFLSLCNSTASLPPPLTGQISELGHNECW